jgi:hypothetical protein
MPSIKNTRQKDHKDKRYIGEPRNLRLRHFWRAKSRKIEISL